jgi:hypothetical protein
VNDETKPKYVLGAPYVADVDAVAQHHRVWLRLLRGAPPLTAPPPAPLPRIQPLSFECAIADKPVGPSHRRTLTLREHELERGHERRGSSCLSNRFASSGH